MSAFHAEFRARLRAARAKYPREVAVGVRTDARRRQRARTLAARSHPRLTAAARAYSESPSRARYEELIEAALAVAARPPTE